MKMNPLDPHHAVPVFGDTRTCIHPRYALITSDGFVPSVWPGAHEVETIFHITPGMGAGFVQARCTWRVGGVLPVSGLCGIETFLFVLSGSLSLNGKSEKELSAGQFALLPPGYEVEIGGAPGSVAFLLQKIYEPLAGVPAPELVTGHRQDSPAVPFLGHQGALLQTLLPEDPAFDLAINIFTYTPGAFLPFVETHIMEHGLIMLAGHGIYRLDNDWFPVREGDVIWMAPYCPQWFVAMGETPASYLYYKNVNRLPSL